ncbi:paeninodin family lasso peptide [Bacillus sp. SD088]|nr:paeninodin family lasso peptide [Bacillus sp. SD088]MBO0992522.1 paeninodin family lasso peptide [Bacillus sp. SD088]
MMKKWQEPKLEVLTIGMTMAGPGLSIPDAVQPDPDPEDTVHYDS